MDRRSFVLISFFLASSILSLHAAPFKDIESLDKFLSTLPLKKGYKSIPSPKTFQGDPSRTAAGILHYAIDKEQGPVILLGLRNDEDTYCNLGGMSETEEEKAKGFKAQSKKKNISSTLAQTASREVEEESNGYYAHHPYDLECQPFIDILAEQDTKKPLLYRMYWKKVQKVDAHILLKALKEGQQEHNKEYRDFIWVPALKLLNSIKQEKSTVQLEGDKDIELFKPLFDTLSTESGQTFLTSIVDKGKISHFDKQFSLYHNRLYFFPESQSELNEEDESSNEETGDLVHATFKLHWELPQDSLFERETYTETLSSGKKLTRYKVPAVPFGQNAAGEKKQTLTLNELNLSYDVPLSTEKDQRDFAYAIAAHGAAMIELKQKAAKLQERARFKEEKEELSQPPSIEGWNSNSDLALSRIHLRMVLGNDFKTAEDFKGSFHPQKAADLANLRTYLGTYSNVEYTQKNVKPEFKRKINFTDADLEILANILEWENQHKKHPVVYHGANANMYNLWESFTHLRELLSISPLNGQKILMRGTDIYFRDVKTIEDILKKYGYEDYTNGRAALVLSANYVLTAGLKTTRTSSSTIEYFLNNHSVAAPEVEEKFDEATSLAGIIGHYPYFRSPFLQFLAHRDPTFENSVIVAISVAPTLLPTHSYAARGGGEEYTTLTTDTPQKKPSALGILKGIQLEYESHKDMLEPFQERMEEKRNLIPEIRLSLHPSFVFHPDVIMKAFSRFPLPPEERIQFEREMGKATIGTLADWLLSECKVMPDSYAEYPSLKRLYHYAYKAITSKTIKERFASESFFHLINNGHIEGIKNFIITFPEIMAHEDFNPRTLLTAAFRTNKSEVVKYIREELFHKSPQEIFEISKDFYKIIRRGIIVNGVSCLDYLLSHYDVKAIPSQITQSWVKTLDHIDSLELFAVFAKYFPEHKFQVLKSLFKEYRTEQNLDELISLGISPLDLTEEHITAHKNKKRSLGDTHTILNMIAKHKVDLSSHYRQTKAPLIFEFIALAPLIYSLEFEQYFYEQLPSLANVKDREGNTIFDHVNTALKNKERNVLLYLASPYKLWLNTKVNPSYTPRPWYDDLFRAFCKKNSENINALLQVIPPYIEETQHVIHVAYDNENAFPKEVNKLRQTIVQQKNAIEHAQKALRDNDFQAFYHTLQTSKAVQEGLYLPDLEPYGKDILPQLNNEELITEESEEMKRISKKLEKGIVDTQDLIGQLTTVSPKILKALFGPILRLNHHDLTLIALRLVYPNLDEFISLASFPIGNGSLAMEHPLIWASIEQLGESLSAMVGYIGNNFPKLALAFGDESFENVLEELPDEVAQQCLKKYPQVFTYVDEENDYFMASLGSLPYEARKAFIFSHQEKLSKISYYGIPYFFYLFLDEENILFLPELVRNNPALLELKTIDNLTLEDFLIDILGDVTGLKTKFKKVIKSLKSQLSKEEHQTSKSHTFH